MKKIVSVLLAASILTAAFSHTIVFADEQEAAETEMTTEKEEAAHEEVSYRDYLASLSRADFKGEQKPVSN